ncbi:hypothetical protein F4802DRAFT_598442 [Xylaria palmicola]|nr:hypothetical protein F4802DRAFT_598442 [Xylaria palmicola]
MSLHICIGGRPAWRQKHILAVTATRATVAAVASQSSSPGVGGGVRPPRAQVGVEDMGRAHDAGGTRNASTPRSKAMPMPMPVPAERGTGQAEGTGRDWMGATNDRTR